MTHTESQSQSTDLAEEDAEILAKTHDIFGNAERGLTVAEIAELLWLQQTSMKIYLRDDRRRIDLYRRLFEQDESIRERASRILESRRVG